MAFVTKEKVFSRKWFISYFLITLGALIMAVGLTVLAFNIPLTIIGIRILGPRFGVKTIVSFVLASVFIDGITWL